MTTNAHRLALTLASSAATLLAFQASTARAHFRLDKPASWAEQNSTGNPQKSGPCGETDSASTPMQAKATNMVTPFSPGETITITITETVNHPGHYRVALAPSRSELPADPAVTAVNGDPCGSTVIQTTPNYPILADGVLKHTAAVSGPQDIKVTLPTNVTCDKCTLQVIQFMSSHALNNPGGCFYHHCADISIKGGGGAGGAGGVSGAGGQAAGAGASSGDAGKGGAGKGGGGAGGASGSAGSGGVAAPAGGSGGSAGSMTAGSTSVAGAVGAGGSVAGSPSTIAGSSGSGTSSAGVSGAGAASPPSEDDGGCAIGARRASHMGLGAVMLGALVFLRRSRRRSRSQSPD